MSFYNKVVLMGNVTRDPEIRVTASNVKIARTGIACNRRYKGSDGSMKEEAMFVDIVCFGRQAEIMEEYVTKGSPLLIDGRLSFNQWEQDGVKRSKHEVNIESFQMIGSRRDRESNAGGGDSNNYKSSNNSNNYDSYGSETITDDDIPF